MLNPDQDRLDYGQMLAPPPGFRLDFAVGTTYSLDLDALVGACLALGLSEETDSALLRNPICLLEALRSTGDKVALFCEGGQIHLPNQVTPLYVLLEKMVFQISPDKCREINGYPAFHPKFWLLRYLDGRGEALYRVCVLSRNLTFDRSWDVTFYMDGKPREEINEKNAPVCDFLEYLSAYAGEKRDAVRKLARELAKVHFSLESREFRDYEFLPAGIGKNHQIGQNPLFQNAFQELLIMSPFVTGSVIAGFNHRCRKGDCVLISREMALRSLKSTDCANFRIYKLKDAVVDGESMISEEQSSIRRQDIHAKIYLVRSGSNVDLYLGSLNATHNAISGNVEFMIRLRTRNRYLDLQKLTQQLFCGGEADAGNPFQPVTMQSDSLQEAEDPHSRLDQVIKALVRNRPHARILPVGEQYEAHVYLGNAVTELPVEVSPLLAQMGAAFAQTVIFPNLSIRQISEFYRVTVSDGVYSVSRVIRIPTAGIPQARDRAIVSGEIRNRSSFYQYIAFLLGDDRLISSLEITESRGDGGGRSGIQEMPIPALYEKMLKTAAVEPEKLRQIDDLLQAVSEDGVIPAEFETMYGVFREAVNLDG